MGATVGGLITLLQLLQLLMMGAAHLECAPWWGGLPGRVAVAHPAAGRLDCGSSWPWCWPRGWWGVLLWWR